MATVLDVPATMDMKLQMFIDSEKEYFEPILAKAKDATPEIWRKETVQQRAQRISSEIFELFGGEVKYGPFKGLQLKRDAWWGKQDLGSQCLGLYEKEILDFIDAISPGQFSTFIDVGAADGYYAIGMLTATKTPKTICFEKSEKGRHVIRSNWERNGSVGDLRILGEANSSCFSELSESDLDGALVLIDIEGFEFELLTDSSLQALKTCTIIIEIHNWVDDFLQKYEKFLSDANKYFEFNTLQRVERSTSDFEELRDLSDDSRLLLTSEGRPCLMRFIQLTPK